MAEHCTMKCLAAVIESKRTATNAMPPRPLSAVPKTSYIWEGKQRQKRLPPLVRIGQLEGAQNWEMWTGTGQQLTVPLERATTTSSARCGTVLQHNFHYIHSFFFHISSSFTFMSWVYNATVIISGFVTCSQWSCAVYILKHAICYLCFYIMVCGHIRSGLIFGEPILAYTSLTC